MRRGPGAPMAFLPEECRRAGPCWLCASRAAADARGCATRASSASTTGGRAEAREIKSSDRAVAQALLRAIGAVENRARSRPFSDPDGELPAPLSKLQTRSWACASQGSEHVPRRFAAAESAAALGPAPAALALSTFCGPVRWASGSRCSCA
jgi:hypothetical protein